VSLLLGIGRSSITAGFGGESGVGEAGRAVATTWEVEGKVGASEGAAREELGELRRKCASWANLAEDDDCDVVEPSAPVNKQIWDLLA